MLHRQNIHYFHQQQLAQGGAAFASPVIQHGLTEVFAGVAHCKAVFHCWSAQVEDLPDEDPLSVLTVVQAIARLT
ncbi:MAG: hypothetical protein OHK0022_10830 [Roseiflexaceae bacterium]